MTIINPTNQKKGTGFFIKILALLFAGGLLYIFFYAHTVDKRHTIKSINERIITLNVENTDLKNTLYNMTNPAELESLAFEHGLIFEKTPQYLRLQKSEGVDVSLR